MQKIHAAVENLFLFNLRIEPWEISLDDFTIIEVKGADALQFINGQTTNDVLNLENNKSILNTRLNHSGKVQAFFYTAKLNSIIFLFIPKNQAETLLIDLNKFIIMEDVELVEHKDKIIYFHANYFLEFENLENAIESVYAGFPGSMSFQSRNMKNVSLDQIEIYFQLNGYPSTTSELITQKLINETRLNDLAISYSKGCFLGQETVAKIENNRGAAYFPMMLESVSIEKIEMNELINDKNESIGKFVGVTKLNDRMIIHVLLNRENRVVGRKIQLKNEDKLFDVKVLEYPFFATQRKEISKEFYQRGLELFHKGQLDDAIEFLTFSHQFYKNADAIEVKGVILGRLEKFAEAIEAMDELQILDPNSVMAHTNKSLFLMRLGKIAEAEEEKSLATVKSFAKFGEEAKIKKQLELEKKKKEEEIASRESMFLKVLDIDNEDSIANFGMADIYYLKGKYIDALNHVTLAIKSNPKYSMAYLLKGKICESLLDTDSAREAFEEGIRVATKNGDMMPANEMQSRLNKLI